MDGRSLDNGLTRSFKSCLFIIPVSAPSMSIHLFLLLMGPRPLYFICLMTVHKIILFVKGNNKLMLIMYQSNRSLNIPPPGIPRAIDVFFCPGGREFDELNLPGGGEFDHYKHSYHSYIL